MCSKPSSQRRSCIFFRYDGLPRPSYCSFLQRWGELKPLRPFPTRDPANVNNTIKEDTIKEIKDTIKEDTDLKDGA